MLTEGPVVLTVDLQCLLCSGLRAGHGLLCWECVADVLAYEPDPLTLTVLDDQTAVSDPASALPQ